jgi:hypothetical protein
MSRTQLVLALVATLIANPSAWHGGRAAVFDLAFLSFRNATTNKLVLPGLTCSHKPAVHSNTDPSDTDHNTNSFAFVNAIAISKRFGYCGSLTSFVDGDCSRFVNLIKETQLS